MGNNRVLTAPLCVIKVNGITIGKMKDLRVTESIRRGKVVGLGSLVPDELPAIEWEGSMTCGFYTIDLKKSMIPGLINRTVTSIEQWTNTVLLQEDGVQIDIYKRVKDPKQPDSSFPNISTDPNFIQRVINGKLELFASVMGCFINREAFNISESSISGRDVEIQYLQPILYSPGS